LNRGLAPEGELLSFASPKESNQRKGDPVAAFHLRSSLSPRVARRAILGPLATRCIHAAPLRAILDESSGARRGKREKYLLCVTSNIHQEDAKKINFVLFEPSW